MPITQARLLSLIKCYQELQEDHLKAKEELLQGYRELREKGDINIHTFYKLVRTFDERKSLDHPQIALEIAHFRKFAHLNIASAQRRQLRHPPKGEK